MATNDQMHEMLSSIGPARVIPRRGHGREVAIPERGIGDHMAGVLRVLARGAVELATAPWGVRKADS